MNELNGIKAGVTAILAMISAALGNLYIPVILMVTCNIIDYATGLMAVGSRDEKLSSYRSINGIIKKVCMWLLVVVGAIVDELIKYAAEVGAVKLPFTFLVACIVAIWIICSELISILENMVDIGVSLPPFLMPIIKLIQKTTEDTAKGGTTNGNSGT
jgi:toxin secretion/phage lysis holin